VDIPDETADLVIPSLILQPLVENAIKHGIANARHGGMVSITAARLESPPRLCIAVRNTGAPLTRHEISTGIGLANVRRRLGHYFGADATVRLDRNEDGSTIAELVVPISDGEDDAATMPTAMGARE
jgi:sensor histidine kinase YesM